MGSLVHLRFPDFLVVDHGSAYTRKEMNKTVEAFGVRLGEASIETPGTIEVVKRYDALLRLPCQWVWADRDRDKSVKECLKLAVVAVNGTVGPEGFCILLLVSGAIPRPARTVSAPSRLERAEIVEIALDEVVKDPFEAKVAFDLRHVKGPKCIGHFLRLPRLLAESSVLVFRTKSKRWEWPFKIVHVEEETVVVQMDHRKRMCRSSGTRPFINPSSAKQVMLTTSSDGSKNFNAENTITEEKSVPEEFIPEGSSPSADAKKRNPLFNQKHNLSILEKKALARTCPFSDLKSWTNSSLLIVATVTIAGWCSKTTVITKLPPSPQRHQGLNNLYSESFSFMPRLSMTSAFIQWISQKRICSQPHRLSMTYTYGNPDRWSYYPTRY